VVVQVLVDDVDHLAILVEKQWHHSSTIQLLKVMMLLIGTTRSKINNLSIKPFATEPLARAAALAIELSGCSGNNDARCAINCGYICTMNGWRLFSFWQTKSQCKPVSLLALPVHQHLVSKVMQALISQLISKNENKNIGLMMLDWGVFFKKKIQKIQSKQKNQKLKKQLLDNKQ
jgi:hypothetical protein